MKITLAQRLAIGALGLLAIGALVMVSIQHDAATSSKRWVGALASLACDSEFVTNGIKEMFRNGPTGKIGIEIFVLKDQKETHRTTEQLECHATAVLNVAEDIGLSYKIYFDDGRPIIQYRPDQN